MITMDLCVGCLDKYILGVGDSATDPAPLKLQKASKNQSILKTASDLEAKDENGSQTI